MPLPNRQNFNPVLLRRSLSAKAGRKPFFSVPFVTLVAKRDLYREPPVLPLASPAPQKGVGKSTPCWRREREPHKRGSPSGARREMSIGGLVSDEAAAGSLPLVSVSLFTPLTPAEMAPYMKSLSRGQNVEDILEVLTDIDEMARRRPEILAFFSTHLQKLMNSEEEVCRNLAFSLALRSIQHNPSIAADFLPTFMYCLGSCDFEVVQTALRNLPEYTLLCQEHAAALLQRAFLVGMYGQVDTSTQISEALKVLHMEAMM